ncbi:MAG: hypothetical protein U5K43_04140 [Halofilum sp. (in: g-proteobacteria)]|nr:hypothetical protein [Halofilum sp. (in: g-proteobacteria)]
MSRVASPAQAPADAGRARDGERRLDAVAVLERGRERVGVDDGEVDLAGGEQVELARGRQRRQALHLQPRPVLLQRLRGLPVARVEAHRHAAPGEVVRVVERVVTTLDQHLAGAVERGGERDPLAARGGHGHVGDDQVAAPGLQRRDQLVEVVHEHDHRLQPDRAREARRRPDLGAGGGARAGQAIDPAGLAHDQQAQLPVALDRVEAAGLGVGGLDHARGLVALLAGRRAGRRQRDGRRAHDPSGRSGHAIRRSSRESSLPAASVPAVGR